MIRSPIVVGAIGTRLKVIHYSSQSGGLMDLTGASVIFTLVDPSGMSQDVVATIDGTPESGKAYYDTIAGDLDEAGTWKLQSKVTIGAKVHRAQAQPFLVVANVDA